MLIYAVAPDASLKTAMSSTSGLRPGHHWCLHLAKAVLQSLSITQQRSPLIDGELVVGWREDVETYMASASTVVSLNPPANIFCTAMRDERVDESVAAVVSEVRIIETETSQVCDVVW